MPGPSSYGVIVHAGQVEDGVDVTLRKWLPDYMGEVLRQDGAGAQDIPIPQEVLRSSEFDWDHGATAQLVIVVSPGTNEVVSNGDSLTMVWDVRATVLASVVEPFATRRAMQIITAAMGAALEQKGVTVRDREASVRLLGESYGLQAPDDSRTLAAGEATLAITVERARMTYGGPDEPSPSGPDGPGQDPAPDTPTVGSATATIRLVKADDPLTP